MQECRRIINQKHDNTVFKAASSLVHNELLNEIYVNGTSGRKQYLLGCPLEKILLPLFLRKLQQLIYQWIGYEL